MNDVNIVMLCMRNIDSAMTSNSLFRELSGSDEEGRENPIRLFTGIDSRRVMVSIIVIPARGGVTDRGVGVPEF